MLCKDVIAPFVPQLFVTDTADDALDLMDKNHLTQLPLLNKETYLGIVSEEALLDWEDTFITFEQANKVFLNPMVLENAHVYDAVKLFTENRLTILPVIDAKGNYVGTITTESILPFLTLGTQAQENGGVVVLSVTQKNYSLSQIARNAESENITILSTLLHTNEEDGSMQLTIKTNKQNLSAFVATLERLNYQIIEVFAENDDEDDMKDNYDSFMRYMQM